MVAHINSFLEVIMPSSTFIASVLSFIAGMEKTLASLCILINNSIEMDEKANANIGLRLYGTFICINYLSTMVIEIDFIVISDFQTYMYDISI